MEEPEQAGVPLEEEEDQNGFFACYMLCSENPRSKGRTYIGFTVNPRRRLRQHNGQLKQGAWLTKKNRPWDMILCVHGFHTQVDALQFEWAWQHPLKSLAVRESAAKIQMKGIRGKVLLLFTMLTCPKWQSMHLNVQFFSTKYTHLRNGCPPLARQMRVSVAPMDDLPCYGSAAPESDEMDLSAEEEEEDAAKEQSPAPESPPAPTSEPQAAEPLGMSSQEMMPSEESDLVPCGTRTLQCSSPWLRRHCSAPESPAADPESLPCQKLPLQESNWMAPTDRIHCNNSWQPRQRRKVRKEPAFFCPPSSSEVIVIDASPLPARSDREVIYIEASPLPVCREVIVIEDSPW